MAKRKCLAVVAHPDDEVLGCGGTLARHAAEGDEVHILILADGESSRAGAHDKEGRGSAAHAAAAALGATKPILLDLPDNRLDTVALLDIVQHIETVIDTVSPDLIYTHHGGDLNIDHRIVHQAVLTAARPQPGEPVQGIYGFETLSSTEWASIEDTPGFRPTRFVDIADHLAAKRAALECYREEMRPFPHARSFEAVEALARYRGASAGLAAAEAFSVIREIVK